MVKLILAGGGNKKQSKLIDSFFLKLLERTKKRILYVPVARMSKNDYDDCKKWFFNTFPSLKNSTKTATSLKEFTNSNIDEFDSIYIGGGNTFKLISEIKSSGFDIFLMKFASKNKIIYGGSAGAIILGKNILTTQDRNDFKVNNFDGLNLINNWSVWPHFQNSELNKVKKFVFQKSSNVISIPENSGCYIDDNKLCTINNISILKQDIKIKKLLIIKKSYYNL